MTIVLQNEKYFYPKWYVLGSGNGRALSRSINRPHVGTILACEKLARFLLVMHGAHTGYANKALLPGRDFLL